MTNKELADLIFPNVNSDTSIYEIKYPERNLDDGAVVSRFAPIYISVNESQKENTLFPNVFNEEGNEILFNDIQEANASTFISSTPSSIFIVSNDEQYLNEYSPIVFTLDGILTSFKFSNFVSPIPGTFFTSSIFSKLPFSSL